MMKKHQLLEKAMRDYSYGINFIALGTQSKIVSDGVFYFSADGKKIFQTEDRIAHCVYDGLRWAESMSSAVFKIKPKFHLVPLFSGMEAHVYGGEILIKDADKTVMTLHPSDLEDMANELKHVKP
jgi:hypothetical protein